MGKQKDEKREMAHSRKRPKRTPKEEAEYTKKMKEIYRKLGRRSWAIRWKLLYGLPI